MRKISGLQIFLFSNIVLVLAVVSICVAYQFALLLPVGSYGPLLTVFLSYSLFFTLSIITYRILVKIYPLPIGSIDHKSSFEFNYHMHLLFYLMIFHPILRSNFLPLPLMKLVYLGLGTKMGINSYSAGIITDGLLVEIGDNTLIGHGAGIHPHAVENDRVSHNRIKIGNNVTIGTMAVVFSGAIIEDNAIVSACALVPKGTHIKRGEIWGGVPAKLIRKNDLETVIT